MTTTANSSRSEAPSDSTAQETNPGQKARQPIRNLLRKVYNKGPKPLRKCLLLAKAAHHFALKRGGWHKAPFFALSRCWQLIRSGGVRSLKWRFHLFLFQVSRSNSYQIPLSNQLTKDQAETVQRALDRRPLISIIIPVYKVDPRWLESCLSSVANQFYENWEAILVDDCSGQPELTSLMKKWSHRDSRFRLRELNENQNISAATNAGIEIAKGEWIGFLDHDDELTPDALTWIAAGIHESPKAKWFYSDEAIISPEGQCLNLHLKPDYSPEFLLSAMYTCHFSVYAADLIRAVGGLRIGFEGAQDHDLALRIADRIHRYDVVHIPRVLYHWRAIESSTAANLDSKPHATQAGQRAVTEALHRRGVQGTVQPSKLCPSMYEIELSPKGCPRVSIIIPTKNGRSDLKTCLTSLREKTNYPNYEVVVIDNQSDDMKLLAFLAKEEYEGRLRVIDYNQPFNHSDMNNEAVATCDSDYIVFLNNDIEMLSERWLETFVATVELDESIAGVGAKLLYPDGTVQHGGFVLGIGGLAGHAHRFAEDREPGYLSRANLLNEFSGATAAMLLMRRSAFEEVGGFDAKTFPTSFNDVDLWIRLQKAGYRCLYNPLVKANHYESKSRKTPSHLETEYEDRLKAKWKTELALDRFYNPNLGLDNELFFNHRPYPIAFEFLKSGELQTLSSTDTPYSPLQNSLGFEELNFDHETNIKKSPSPSIDCDGETTSTQPKSVESPG